MHELIDEIKYSKRKTLAIEVKAGGKVLLRAPKGCSRERIERFIQEKRDWILSAKAKMSKIEAPRAQEYHECATFLFLGKACPMHFVKNQKSALAFSFEEGLSLPASRQSDAQKLLIAFYRQESRKLASHFINQYASKWNLDVKSLKINGAKTRWGSCSGKNSINISYRLAMTPIAAFEYVIVHELAHTVHHNHSAEFWHFLSQMLPDYEKRRAWLKQNGRFLPEI
jgi:predicted metal-dependent hydrolase